jgi:hypothetical protein
MLGRALRDGLSSLWDRAAARLAALRFNPSRNQRLIGLGVFFFAVGVAAGVQGYTLAALIWILFSAYSFWLPIHEAGKE